MKGKINGNVMVEGKKKSRKRRTKEEKKWKK
jgi:hypothetical protein